MVRIETEIKLDFKDVLIRPKRSTLRSRAQVDLNRTYTFKHSKREWTGVPIMAANMDTVGNFKMAEELAKHRVITCIHKHYTVEEWVEWASQHPDILPFVAVSAGTSEEDLNKVDDIMSRLDVGMICMDVANGYSEFFVNAVRRTRERHPTCTIIAGNVVTGEMVEELILSGADVVKADGDGLAPVRCPTCLVAPASLYSCTCPVALPVEVGIGPGSVCTTRKQTGVGYPQLSAVMECADAAHGLDGRVVADGGCTCPGDVAKAFAAGADFVMIGGMLAGHDEAAGEVVELDGKYYKKFYGMSSATAMEKHAGGVAEYRSSEGKTVMVPYRGPVTPTMQDILGGIRSTCTYVGASKLKELSKRTTFVRVSQQLNQIFGEDQRRPPAPKN